jgi:hypothetical protein
MEGQRESVEEMIEGGIKRETEGNVPVPDDQMPGSSKGLKGTVS